MIKLLFKPMSIWYHMKDPLHSLIAIAIIIYSYLLPLLYSMLIDSFNSPYTATFIGIFILTLFVAYKVIYEVFIL